MMMGRVAEYACRGTEKRQEADDHGDVLHVTVRQATFPFFSRPRLTTILAHRQGAGTKKPTL